jgi:hypothetical protein
VGTTVHSTIPVDLPVHLQSLNWISTNNDRIENKASPTQGYTAAYQYILSQTGDFCNGIGTDSAPVFKLFSPSLEFYAKWVISGFKRIFYGFSSCACKFEGNTDFGKTCTLAAKPESREGAAGVVADSSLMPD